MFLISGLVLALGMAMTPGRSGGEAMMETARAGSRTIIVIGASYAGSWDPQRPLAGYRIVTKGVSGEQSSQVLARFEADALAMKPDAVIIWGFINDIFRADRARIGEALDVTRKNVLAMVEATRQAGVKPILATEVTIPNRDRLIDLPSRIVGRLLGKEGYQDYINRHVIETNRWLRETALLQSILVLDFEKVLADADGARRSEFATSDGSHLSRRAYDALSEYADKELTVLLSFKGGNK